MIGIAPLVALALAAGEPQAPAPEAATAALAPAALQAEAAPEGTFVRKQFLFSAGAGGLDGGGVSPQTQVGIGLDPWDRLGFRLLLGATLGTGWGAIELSPQIAWRLAGEGARVTPYLAGGVQVSAMNLLSDSKKMYTSAAPQGLGAGRTASARSPGGTPVASATSSGAGDTGGGGLGPEGPPPFHGSFGPLGAAGVQVRVAPGVFVDLSARYDLRFFQGSSLSGASVILGVAAPL